jgi:hypothetical protein
MRIKSTAFISLALILTCTVLLAGSASLAADTPAKDAAPATQVAVFAVPNLSDAAVVKDLNMALAKEKGILAAKAETETGKFLVTFETAQNSPEALTQVVTKVAPQAKLDGVRAADAKPAAHGDCGKCPSKSSCGKAKKS